MTDPTPLAKKIADEHRIARCPVHGARDCSVLLNGCSLLSELHRNALHVATLTEQATREQGKAAGPTVEIHAWGATPEQADSIFTAAVDAAMDAAPAGVDVDAVGKLAGAGRATVAPRQVRSGSKRTWRELLAPFADLYAGLDEAIVERVQRMSDDELVKTLAATKRPTQTNAPWAAYGVAPLLAHAIEFEQRQRARASTTEGAP